MAVIVCVGSASSVRVLVNIESCLKNKSVWQDAYKFFRCRRNWIPAVTASNIVFVSHPPTLVLPYLKS